MSVNDSRKDKKDKLRSTIETIPELVNKITYYDARNSDELYSAVERFKNIDWVWKCQRKGHFGVWASTISAWEYIAKSSYDGVILFEDDAELHPHFDFLLRKYMPELPEDWDFFTLHSPHNQDQDFNWDYNFDKNGNYRDGAIRYENGAPVFDIGQKNVCRAYMGYGAVAIMYSPRGAQKFLDHVYSRGVWSSSDCQIFQMSKFSEGGGVNGYCIKPKETKPATTPIDSLTQIHNSDLFDLGQLLKGAKE